MMLHMPVHSLVNSISNAPSGPVSENKTNQLMGSVLKSKGGIFVVSPCIAIQYVHTFNMIINPQHSFTVVVTSNVESAIRTLQLLSQR